MKKALSILCMAVFLLSLAGTAFGESLYVDNRETDKIYPERLNLRSEPSRSGGILGLYYTGTEVNVISKESDGYVKVEIAGVTGYMASEYLITLEEAQSRYGEESDFGAGREAEVDLSGMWVSSISLLPLTDPDSTALGSLTTGDTVGLLGIVDSWAYVTADLNGERTLGYVPLDALTDVGGRKVLIVAGKKADSQTNLYDEPSTRAQPIMALKNGTTCFSLFGRREGEWRKVRVGGVTGWIKGTQTGNLYELGDEPRSVIPYYPLQMQTKSDALLLSVRDDKTQRFMTLGQDMRVEILAESGDSAYVRTLEGGAGAYNCGDYGYIALRDLSLVAAGSSFGIAQMDDGDLPGILLSEPDEKGKMVGALCSGAQVRIASFTQTNYVQVSLGETTAYVLKNEIRVLGEEGETASQRIPQRAMVKENANLSAKPENGTQGEESVEAGTRVYMLGVCGDWAFVQASEKPGLTADSADHTGFLPLSVLDAPASTTHLTASVNTDKVNLRSEASKNGEIIGKARLNERLRVADYGTSWTCVVTPEGKRGYLMTEYLTFP